VILFAGIPVAEIASGRPWYERLMGRPPDLIPNDNEVAWQVAEEGWIYVVADSARAGSGLLTILVDDLDGQLAELASRDIATGEIETIPGAARKATLTDPDGNKITFGEVLRQ